MKQLRDIADQIGADYQAANYRRVFESEQIEFRIGAFRVRCLNNPEAVAQVRKKFVKGSRAAWLRPPTSKNLRTRR